MDSVATELPLLVRTPSSWARCVLRDPLALLSDHAHLEKKAAANALELLNRWPQGAGEAAAGRWVRTLTAVAKDEVEHLAAVTRLIERRGGRLARLHKNPYASALRRFVRIGAGDRELIDRVLVSALIELRSCERFELLAQVAEDSGLAKFYRGLCGSERGHYTVFLELARLVGESETQVRWDEALRHEAQSISAQPPSISMHGGFGV